MTDCKIYIFHEKFLISNPAVIPYMAHKDSSEAKVLALCTVQFST